MARHSAYSDLMADMMAESEKSLRTRFSEGASIEEGVGGCAPMGSTEFENTQTRGDRVTPKNGQDDPAATAKRRY